MCICVCQHAFIYQSFLKWLDLEHFFPSVCFFHAGMFRFPGKITLVHSSRILSQIKVRYILVLEVVSVALSQ